MLSAFLIDVVSEVDPSVPPFLGESVLIRYDDEAKRVVLGPLKEETYKEKMVKRKEIFKLLWQTLKAVGEDKVYKELHKLFTG